MYERSYAKIQHSERSHIRLKWFPYGSSILIELEFGDVGFCGGRKTGVPREKPLKQAMNHWQQQTQQKYGTQQESNQDHIAGMRVLSPLHNFSVLPLRRSESSFFAYNRQNKICEVLRGQILQNSIFYKFKICQPKS